MQTEKSECISPLQELIDYMDLNYGHIDHHEIKAMAYELLEKENQSFQQRNEPKKVFFIDEVREWVKQIERKEISYSKLIEILNEKATGISALELYKLEHPEQFKDNL